MGGVGSEVSLRILADLCGTSHSRPRPTTIWVRVETGWCCDDSVLPLPLAHTSPTFQQLISVRGWGGDVHPRQYPLPRSPCPTGWDHTPNGRGLPGIPPAHGCSAGRPPHVPTTPHTGIETLTAVQAVIRVSYLRAVCVSQQNGQTLKLLWCLCLDYQQ